MAATPSRVHDSRNSVGAETGSRTADRRFPEPAVAFNLERSRESRRRHRVLMSVQHCAVLFEQHNDDGPRLH